MEVASRLAMLGDEWCVRVRRFRMMFFDRPGKLPVQLGALRLEL
jgi:hypothetical protein